MKNSFFSVCALLLFGAVGVQAVPPVVSNIRASQRTGTKFVDIYYDVTASTSSVTVAVQASGDGGLTYTIPAGPFQMGDSFYEAGTDQQPLHNVEVSGFFMDRTEVSKELWSAVHRGCGIRGEMTSTPLWPITITTKVRRRPRAVITTDRRRPQDPTWPMAMASTIWQAMSGNGAGTGMAVTITAILLPIAIPRVRLRARTGCCAGASGATTRASAALRAAATTTWGSAPPAVQSHENSRQS